MSALDGSIVNTALPVIGRQTGAPLSSLEWVILVYLLTVISTLLVFGRLADIYGRRRFYIAGMVVFVTGSLLCGLSRSVHALIAARALQGLGGAMLFALAPAVLTTVFAVHERGRALGMQATMTYLGLSAGPALGGFLTQRFGWPSIFFINVPLGLIVVPLSIRTLRHDEAGARQPFDVAGAVLLAMALASLMFVLSRGHQARSQYTYLLAALGIAAFAAFVMVELRSSHPMLDLRLFRNRTFAASTLAAFLNYTASASVSFLMPFFLQYANGYRVDLAGLTMISTSVVMALFAFPAGWLSDRVGQRLPATLGMAITVAGILSLRMLNLGVHPWVVAAHLAIIGLGIGLFTSPNNSAIMGSAPLSRQGVAGALLAAARNFGFAMGVAISGLIYMTRLHGLERTLPEPHAIAYAMHDALTVMALIASIGVVASALRGKIVRPE